jgi:hypothetical protein
VVVRTPTPDRLAQALTPLGVAVTPAPEGILHVAGTTAPIVGHAAWQAGIELHVLREESSSLESLFLELTEQAPADAAPERGWTG